MVHVVGVITALAGSVLLQLAVNIWYYTGPISYYPMGGLDDAAIYYLTPGILFVVWVWLQVRLFKRKRSDPARIRDWLLPIAIWLIIFTPLAFIGGHPGQEYLDAIKLIPG